MSDALRSFGTRWNKKTKSEVAFEPEAEVLSPEAVPLDIPAVDLMLGGGIPRGRTSILIGEPSSGKTLLSQLVIAAAQRAGGTAMFFDIERCVTAGHRILTTDLRWVPVETLQLGDKILGFEEKAVGGQGSRRRFAIGEVTSNESFEAEAWELILEDGSTLVCTEAHKWLVYDKGNASRSRPGGSVYWATPKFFKKSDLPILKKAFEPWEDDDRDRSIGWLAGFFDGEGTLYQHKRSDDRGTVTVSAKQNEGVVAECVRQLLHDHSFRFSENGDRCLEFGIRGGLDETLRFLGLIRPVRLLKKLDVSKLGSVPTAARVKVVSAKKIGRRMFYGLSTTCKTYFAEGFCAHNTYDAKWFALTGVDISPEKLLVVRPESMEQTFDMVIDALKKVKPAVIVVDSIPAMVPQDVMKASMEDKDFRGLSARKITEGVAKATQYNNETALIFLNQLRINMGVKFGNPESMPGGKGLKFHASLLVRVRRGTWLTTATEGDKDEDGFSTLEDDKDAKRIGFMLRLRTEKNKCAPPWQDCALKFFFNGVIDPLGSLIHLAQQRGIIEVTGSWFKLPGVEAKLHGLGAVEEAIREDEELKARLVTEIQGQD